MVIAPVLFSRVFQEKFKRRIISGIIQASLMIFNLLTPIVRLEGATQLERQP
jgi:hypothetical protein